MKKSYKAHPLMALRLLKPFLFVLVLPVAEGALQYLLYRRINSILAAEIIIFIAIFIFSVMRCQSFEISVDNRKITLKSGVVFKKTAAVRLDKISAVTLRRNPLDILFFAATLSVCTEAGRPGSTDFEMKVRKKDGEELMRRIYGSELQTAVRFSWARLAASAALTSSAVTGLIIGVPLLNRAGKVFGNAFNEMIFSELNTVSTKFNTYFPPIFNTVILILLGAYGISFVYSLIRAIKFRLFEGKERLEIHSGFIVRRRTVFMRNAVQDISVEQTLLMRLANRYMLCATVAGFATSRDKRAIIIPCGTAADLHAGAAGLPFFEAAGKQIRPSQGRKSLMRFIGLPLALAAVIVALTLAAMLAIPYFDRFILIISLALMLGDIWLGWYFFYLCRRGKLRFGKGVMYARAPKSGAFCELYIPKENIGAVRITRSLADMRQGTCNVRVAVRSEKGNRIKVWHLDYECAKENILEFLK